MKYPQNYTEWGEVLCGQEQSKDKGGGQQQEKEGTGGVFRVFKEAYYHHIRPHVAKEKDTSSQLVESEDNRTGSNLNAGNRSSAQLCSVRRFIMLK